MNRLLPYGLALAIGCIVLMGDDSACTLHLSKIGNLPNFIGVKFLPDGPYLRIEVADEHIASAYEMPLAKRVALFGETSADSQNKIPLGCFDLPDRGRFLLLLSPETNGAIRKILVPADAEQFPVGSVGFINLTSRKLRCFIEREFVEISPGEMKVHPSISIQRRIVNHRLQTEGKDAWMSEGTSTIILGANRRFLFVLREDDMNGPIRRGLVTDYAPQANLSSILQPAPVKAEPPLPDPPAK